MANSIVRSDTVLEAAPAALSNASTGRDLPSRELLDPATQEGLARQIAELGEWFHNINLLGVWTAPAHFLGDFPNLKWKHIATEIPQDLSGATVLDIGCNGGFYAIEMKRRGAERVIGIDVDERYLNQARFAAD